MTNFLSLKDHVYNYISEKITEGDLKPDEKINEKTIMQDLNVSRTPIREALIQLSTEGYLENIPRRGFTVKQVDMKKAKEVYALLGVLDAFGASLAFDKLSEEDLIQMDELIDQMDKAINSYDLLGYYQIQKHFHAIYLNKCDNIELVSTLDRLKRTFIRQIYSETETENITLVLKKTNEEHRQITKLFKEENSLKLEGFLRNTHWNQNLAYYDSLLEKNNDQRKDTSI